MEMIFVDQHPFVCSALRSAMPGATVRECRLEEIQSDEFDILLTPGNSFGFMDGGFDLAVRNRFPGVEEAVQRNIKDYYQGMLGIGNAFAVVANQQPRQFLVYAPTMRVPMPIAGTDNVYWAFRAAMLAVRALVETQQVLPYRGLRILSPAFGTSAGYMVFVNAAHQMRLAFEHAMRSKEQIEAQHTWAGGWADHNQIQQYK